MSIKEELKLAKGEKRFKISHICFPMWVHVLAYAADHEISSLSCSVKPMEAGRPVGNVDTLPWRESNP